MARNDRNRTHNGVNFLDIPHLRKACQGSLTTPPTGPLSNRGFRCGAYPAIYSGPFRISDLVSMQPNIKIDLFMVAPDERREKVFYEINRPTFARLKPPLPKICRFIPYSELKKEVEQIGNRMRYMKPEFISEIAESCEPDYT